MDRCKTKKKTKKAVVKSTFLQINDKRFYFADGITSIPLSHPHLQELVDFKAKKGQKIEIYYWQEKETLSEIKNRAQESNERLFLYHLFLMREPVIFPLNQKEKFIQKLKN